MMVQNVLILHGYAMVVRLIALMVQMKKVVQHMLLEIGVIIGEAMV